jgi:hypothetical protein
MLRVDLRTIKNWEQGKNTITYAAYKLIRILGRYELPFNPWGNWFVDGNTLYSLSGRTFYVHELTYIGNYFSMARMWLKDADKRALSKHSPPKPNQPPPILRIINRGMWL